jgi:hypothetical protein
MEIWLTIGAFAALTYATRASGVFAGRVAERAATWATPLTVGVLASVATVATFDGSDATLKIDGRSVGALVAGIATWRRAPFLVALLLAVLCAAAWRFISRL